MGVMTKLRESTSFVLWIVVFAFGGIWVLMDTGVMDNFGSMSNQNIAVVNGTPIPYDEYRAAFDQQIRTFRNQNGHEPTQAQRDQIADQVYQWLIDTELREREMTRLGIVVTDNEVRNMIIGDNPHPVIAQLFPDAQGGVDRARIVELFNDEEMFFQIYEITPVALESYLRDERRQEKLASLLNASIRVSEQEIVEEYVRRNQRATAEYVALRPTDVTDDEVEITDRDLRDYYNANREDFFRPRTVTLQYVVAPQIPSAADSQSVSNRLEGFRSDFAAATDDSAYVAQRFSPIPYTGAYQSAATLEPVMATAIFSDLTPGRIVGPLGAMGHMVLAKIQDVRPAENEAVRARHILIGQAGDSEEMREEQRARAEELLFQIQNGEISFEDAAMQFSQDPGSGARGGDLGYFGRGRMVAPFETAAFGAAPGEIVGPVETNFGYHLIEVTDRADVEVRLAIIAEEIPVSSVTMRRLQDTMQDIKFDSERSGGDLEVEAERHGFTVQTMTIDAEQAMIPGVGTNREIRTFVESARRNRGSDIIDMGDQFVYLYATAIQQEGYRPFNEVREELEPRVLLEKKKELLAERLQTALDAHGFDGLADALGVTVQTASQLRLINPSVSGLGREPIFVGTALGLPEGTVSRALTGNSAVYVLRVTEVVIPDMNELTGEQYDSIRTAIITRKVQLVEQQWLQELRDQADVQDLRDSQMF